jgi:hypothetical protein
MRIGQPFSLPDLGRRARGHDLGDFTSLIMTHIAALVDERHRGQYADSPALGALLAGGDPWPYCQTASEIHLPGKAITPEPATGPNQSD